MQKNAIETIFGRLATVGGLPTDSEDLKLQKSLLVICSFFFSFAGAAWGVMYIFMDLLLPGLIPLCYSLFSLGSVLYFSYSHRFETFRFSQLLLILLLPFLLMLALGGFVNGSAVILWSILSPLGAMLFGDPKKSYGWMIGFAVLIALSLVLQPMLPSQNTMTPAQIGFFFVLNLVTVGALIFMMVYYFVGKKNFYQQRSDALLLNILPRQIAEELKENGMAAPRQYVSVTVMFTDFKNFTQLAEKMGPTELVSEIDRYFKAFDRVTSRMGLEKIKTIGDAYMCAGGLPVEKQNHAADVVNAALQIMQFIREEAKFAEQNNKRFFDIRIGIHTGAVVAGIVGEKKFAYDIWGDAVNIAARMESSGEVGKINISGSTFALIKDQFACTYRGKVYAKNKGEIDMYFVEGKKDATSLSPLPASTSTEL
ncbi:MAG: adenylate/guanylate cyclase domain-containing protein [Flavisolibacter sp.]